MMSSEEGGLVWYGPSLGILNANSLSDHLSLKTRAPSHGKRFLMVFKQWFSPFQVVYSAQPHGPLDLMTPQVSNSVPKKVQDFVAGLHDVHNVVRDNLVHVDSKYKQDANQKQRHVDFEVNDFVWAVLTKDHFPVGEYNKLSAKKIGPLEIVEKINSNAYRLKLPSHIRCSDVFNGKHLLPYHGDSSDNDSVGNSRTNFVYP
uniref:Putative reverse transcriptase domain-containing protein n=1 Tax=Tanacetum cinerariifolium TaxID=118510 RepID=A0A699JIA5_TANCI|nr:putative reverse transcriptase domain-containing protein [Tanacetum cinerariifolium]